MADHIGASLVADRMGLLNRGQVEAANLAECLSVDFAVLMQAIFEDMPLECLEELKKQQHLGITQRMKLAASQISQACPDITPAFFLAHPSDTVRGWGCFWINLDDTLSLADCLTAIQPFANDSHFGVREWAWLAIRDRLIDQIDESVALLLPWTTHASAYIRRFASESIRPRGVWSRHCQRLKDNPEVALPVLEALRADEAAYVQKSVGNWLNDAAKSEPDWVIALCTRWQNESTHAATSKICRIALRSFNKK